MPSAYYKIERGQVTQRFRDRFEMLRNLRGQQYTMVRHNGSRVYIGHNALYASRAIMRGMGFTWDRTMRRWREWRST